MHCRGAAYTVHSRCNTDGRRRLCEGFTFKFEQSFPLSMANFRCRWMKINFKGKREEERRGRGEGRKREGEEER